MTHQFDKAAQEYVEREYSGCMEDGDYTHSGKDVTDAARCGFIDGANHALQNQWISVDDMLPDNHIDVLAHVPQQILHAYNEVTYWDGEDWYTQDGDLIRPDFWMPIPTLNPTEK